MRSALRLAIAGSIALAVLSDSSVSSATGVLAPVGAPPPSTLDVTTAIAVSPSGTTRWAQVTMGGVTRAMWLVPARAGADLDWATPNWFDALETSTALRILHPIGTDTCAWPEPQFVPPMTTSGPRMAPKAAPRIHVDLADLRAHLAARGFALSAEALARVGTLYQQGYRFVSAEFEVPQGTIVTSPTIRVVDDGAAVVPMALAGSSGATVRATAYVIADRPLTFAGATDATPQLSLWGRYGSRYPEDRFTTLSNGAGDVWLRESAGSVVVATPSTVPWLHESYFGGSTACISGAAQVADASGVVGRVCPPGALGHVPGGTACTPSAGDIDPGALTCQGADDLALALAGLTLRDATVSRFVGLVPLATLGRDLPLSPAPGVATLAPTARANDFAPCTAPPVAVPSPVGPSNPTAPASPTQDEGSVYYTTVDSCSGGTSSSSTSSTSADESPSYDDGDGCGGSTTTSSSESDSSGSSSSDSCDSGSSSSSSSGSDDDGWDSDDSSSSSDSDSCSGSGSSSSSSSGDMAPTRKVKSRLEKRPHASRRGSSPVSRFAFVAIALVLPLRRRLRQRTL